MSFQERFKERATFLSKEGVIGAIAQSATPIEKTPSNKQFNYSNGLQKIKPIHNGEKKIYPLIA